MTDTLTTETESPARQTGPQKKAALWLDEQVKMSQQGIATLDGLLTPTLATVLLERNPKNRAVKPTVVAQYARDIRQGTWAFNGESIIIARDGHMNNGQHRCHAVIEAGKPIRTLFVFGVERDTMDTLDQGAIRKLSDYLAMGGHVDVNSLAAVAQLFWSYQLNGNIVQNGRVKATKGELIKLVERYPGLQHSVKAAWGFQKLKMASTSQMAFVHFILSRVAPEKEVDEFFRRLRYGEDLNSASPILYARNKLMSQNRYRPNEKMEILIRTWNLHVEGEDKRIMKLQGGRLPEILRPRGYD